ncbi:transporter substrate-binding domain-containing protein [Erysipelatoclostridium sp. AM42-17]|uniref:transporter substrate-binding domain-containing protein n=1 Tax=Erysipelatoclostridium sp. AM42-17 TaxID=2293102 RepID=UPI000E46BF31|nr:transporter substrate-binding domain-containing protein [Erysipelatoclostridium sp. AM42-17]RHS95821.1 hypothetical protein DW911_02110 [Erysipelatoclostridium sp. AM42-17]
MMKWTKKLATGITVGVMMLSIVGCSSSSSSGGSVLEQIASRGTLKVGVSENKLGFALENTKTGKLDGLEIMISEQIAKDIAKKEKVDKIDVDFTKVNAKTRTSMLDEGTLDFSAASVTITQERAKSWNFSSSYFNDPVSVMTKKGAFPTGVKGFKDKGSKVIIGVLLGTTSKDALIKYAKETLGLTNFENNVEFKEFNTNDEVLIALDSGVVDGYCCDYTQLFAYKTNKYEILGETVGDNFEPQPLGIITRYKTATDGEDKEFTAFIQSEIKKFWKSGQMNKWFKACGYPSQKAPTDLDLKYGPYHHGKSE